MPEVRLIDANALQYYLCTNCDWHDTCSATCWAIRTIRLQETIETEPVRHGRWIRRETVLDTECKCSVCGYKDFVPKHDNYWFRRKFCPNCGARMDGGADND